VAPLENNTNGNLLLRILTSCQFPLKNFDKSHVAWECLPLKRDAQVTYGVDDREATFNAHENVVNSTLPVSSLLNLNLVDFVFARLHENSFNTSSQ
jgi:hypothetical protein